MAFDADAFREAHRPWRFIVGGRVFPARHVSGPQCATFDQMRADAKTAKDVERAYRWVLRHAFPWRFSYLLYGDPVRILMDMEPPARTAALLDFFACLRGETTPEPPQSRKTVAWTARPRNGRPSDAPTPQTTP